MNRQIRKFGSVIVLCAMVLPESLLNQHSLKRGVAKEGLCRHDFMKVCVEGVQVAQV